MSNYRNLQPVPIRESLILIWCLEIGFVRDITFAYEFGLLYRHVSKIQGDCHAPQFHGV